MSQPLWLPPLCSTSGLREQVISDLYQVFIDDFKSHGCMWNGLPVGWDRRILPGESYEEGFWHLVSRDYQKTKERHFDPLRASRLSWCKPLIEHAHDPSVTVWRERARRNRIRIHFWLEEQDYTAILEEKSVTGTGGAAFLLTAYHVDGRSTRRTLRTRCAQGLP